jgi:hypothetical protein
MALAQIPLVLVNVALPGCAPHTSSVARHPARLSK